MGKSFNGSAVVAIREGRLKDLRYLRENGLLRPTPMLFREAVKSGNINVVCSLAMDLVNPEERCLMDAQRLIRIATKRNDRAMLTTIYRIFAGNGNTLKDAEPSVIAARNGHFDLIPWLHDHHYPISHDEVILMACEQGHLPTLQYYQSKFWVIYPESLLAAARGGQLHIVEWLLENNICIGFLARHGLISTMQLAVAYDHPDVVLHLLHTRKWTMSKRKYWPCMQIAADRGNIAMMQLLKDNGIYRSPSMLTLWNALQRGDTHVLEWTFANFKPEVILQEGRAGEGVEKIMDWAEQKGLLIRDCVS
jgi:hypothetical protein